METRNISFSVDGTFITKLAREKCHYEGKYNYAIDLLMGCMETDELNKREIKQMANEILNGEAELRGVYPNDDYGFFYLDEKDEKWNLGKSFEKCLKKKIN